jgi:hypothetical protein
MTLESRGIHGDFSIPNIDSAIWFRGYQVLSAINRSLPSLGACYVI